MKTIIEKSTLGQRQIIGYKYELMGRIKGALRSRKISRTWGYLGLQDILRRAQYSQMNVNTRYGTLGCKTILTYTKLSALKWQTIEQ